MSAPNRKMSPVSGNARTRALRWEGTGIQDIAAGPSKSGRYLSMSI
jgi:hypothetical protein